MNLFSSICACLPRLRSDHTDASASPTATEAAAAQDYSGLFFNLESLQIATNFFSDLNQLGRGGFGPVYKGLLPNGQEVAVKKLSLNSRQGLKEFMNEMNLLRRVQHKNLVMLLGCCVEGPEKMLVYEYLENRSLDYFLFDKRKSPRLDWTKRFRMVKGIARGLLYLHEEAPERIIHRDIKASNILLDEQLNPKIADFGLARLFPEDDTHLSTFKISGTLGYMAPEYARRGYISVKTDVFSFGILVLEIVSGRRNYDRLLGSKKADLLRFAWKSFQNGRSLELVDPSLDQCSEEEVAMCVHLGLLCCQASFMERPDMNAIHLMLLSDSFTLPMPGKPGIHGRMGEGLRPALPPLTNNANGSVMTPTTGTVSIEDSRNSISDLSTDEGR